MIPEIWLPRAPATEDADGLAVVRALLVAIPVSLGLWGLIFLVVAKWLLG